MSASDIIALLAIFISMWSLFLSYRATRFANIVSVAEKRTQADSVLVKALLEAEELLSVVQAINICGGSEAIISKLSKLEKQLLGITEGILERLNWLRGKNCEDPIIIEEYKAYSFEVAARVKQIAPIISELKSIGEEIENVSRSTSPEV